MRGKLERGKAEWGSSDVDDIYLHPAISSNGLTIAGGDRGSRRAFTEVVHSHPQVRALRSQESCRGLRPAPGEPLVQRSAAAAARKALHHDHGPGGRGYRGLAQPLLVLGLERRHVDGEVPQGRAVRGLVDHSGWMRTLPTQLVYWRTRGLGNRAEPERARQQHGRRAEMLARERVRADRLFDHCPARRAGRKDGLAIREEPRHPAPDVERLGFGQVQARRRRDRGTQPIVEDLLADIRSKLVGRQVFDGECAPHVPHDSFPHGRGSECQQCAEGPGDELPEGLLEMLHEPADDQGRLRPRHAAETCPQAAHEPQ